MTDWNAVVKEALEAPCAHCGDSDVSHPLGMEHEAMPQVDHNALQAQRWWDTMVPNEVHHIDPGAHCENPKCGYYFTPADEAQIRQNRGEFTCPRCGWTQNVYGLNAQPTYEHENPDKWYDLMESGNLDVSPERPANPGGRTNSGLTLKQMGDIGEAIVFRMGELPGIGPVHQASTEYNYPIDAIVDSQRGKFGCEIKTNHSTAQQRFKITGKDPVSGETSRIKKIKFCLQNGLKPALIGVRLNFYTDLAYIFFREGLTDTWIGNRQMMHVATVNFADLNPFKSPDPQAQAIAINNANLPDQADEGDNVETNEDPDADIDAAFGPAPTPTSAPIPITANQHALVVPFDVHALKVRNTKGEHTHTIKRCPHCGVLYQRAADHRGYFACPTCDSDVDEEPRLPTRVVFAGRNDPMDKLAESMGWRFHRRTGKGERMYIWTDPDDFVHDLRTGPGGSHGDSQLDAMHMRQRMMRCMENPWACQHAKVKGIPPANRSIDPVAEPGAPVLRKGQVIEVNDRLWFIHEIDRYEGQILVAVTDLLTGKHETFTADEIPPQKAAAVEDWSSAWN